MHARTPGPIAHTPTHTRSLSFLHMATLTIMQTHPWVQARAHVQKNTHLVTHIPTQTQFNHAAYVHLSIPSTSLTMQGTSTSSPRVSTPLKTNVVNGSLGCRTLRLELNSAWSCAAHSREVRRCSCLSSASACHTKQRQNVLRHPVRNVRASTCVCTSIHAGTRTCPATGSRLCPYPATGSGQHNIRVVMNTY